MNEIPMRKWTTFSEEIHTAGGPAADPPPTGAAVAAVIRTLYAARSAETLGEPIEPIGALDAELAARHARAA
jgi:hypothetical protein